MANKKTVILNLLTLVKVVVVRSTDALCENHGLPYDWVFDLPEYYAKVYVYKRPHLDFFIKKIYAWCHLIVFTTSDRVWTPLVLDYLDGGQNVLNKRLDGSDYNRGLGFDHLSLAYNDLTGKILLAHTNQISADNKDNTIPIDDYVIGAWDQKLLTLLPIIDSLRFVEDVRSILRRYRR
ncbi:CTD nuclear envelope phosphatase 1-like [Drosophila obscura]|uniref:CTD nuclear envelope phosphatase 1-like n=1 Tax=Drosophila obscura TaxID=7282 RepID=UPI001BB1301A|nr:CTD nuclear envelope phosphatase 1-like [Drosophila obscura]